jgi:deoxyuridine 5'-triphosphate nucleotidohydrolase
MPSCFSKRKVNRCARVLFKFLNKHAKMPMKGTPDSVGYDLYSSEDVVIKPGERSLVGTGLAFDVRRRDGYARIAPRSGLAVDGIDIGAGVVDFSYRDEIKVVVVNNRKISYDYFFVRKGDRIAQMIFEKVMQTKMIRSDVLSKTKRGKGGFGSTGKR